MERVELRVELRLELRVALRVALRVELHGLPQGVMHGRLYCMEDGNYNCLGTRMSRLRVCCQV